MTTKDIIIILDESGSMVDMGDEPIQSLNNFISEQKKIVDDSKFTLWKFNTTYSNIFDDVLLQNVVKFKDYNPSGMTALYDTIFKAINTKLKKHNHNSVICVIITDGVDNSSIKKASEIKSLINMMENEYKWKFLFFGANIDTFTEGSKVGVSNNYCTTFKSTPQSFRGAVEMASQKVSSIRQQY